MTNEQIVSEIRNGYSVTDYMQLLYEESNLPLIKKFIKPYAAYEPMEDLLQEAYFGLWEAVQHYETSENVRFMTYAEYWIRQSVQRYLEKCGSMVRIPSHIRQKIARYKKTVQELEQELGKVPTDNEIADKMRVSVGLLPELRIQMQGVASLDTL
ncbi:MAG: sigma-70 family RNA polymerase sigma factor [Lachnospiraceae bacterium]|nr:sigma-70 family RNA polymerase sigma factor [Lachnospiraceae bacterium]